MEKITYGKVYAKLKGDDIIPDKIAIMEELDIDVDIASGFCYIGLNSGQP